MSLSLMLIGCPLSLKNTEKSLEARETEQGFRETNEKGGWLHAGKGERSLFENRTEGDGLPL